MKSTFAKEKNNFKEDKSALVSQAESQLVFLNDQLKKLRAEITTAQAVKSDIDAFITQAYRKKDEECAQIIKQCESAQEKAKAMIGEYEKKINALAKDRDSFEEYKMNESARMVQISESTEFLNQCTKEKLAANELETTKLKEEKSANLRMADENRSIKESNEKQLKTLNVIKEDTLFLKQEAESRIAKAEAAEKKEKEAADKNQTILEQIFTAQRSLDKTKSEVAAIEKNNSETKVESERIFSRIHQDKEDAILLGKQNQIEAYRLSGEKKRLKNWEADITRKQNILNTEIGGHK